MKRYFEKMVRPKTFTLEKKNQLEKKNRGSSRVEGSGLQLGMIPYFFNPREIPLYVRFFLSPCLFPVIYPLTGDGLREIWKPQKIFKNSGFRNSKTLSFYNNVIHIFSKGFTGRFVNYPVDEEVFWKKWRGQRLWIKAKQIKLKKNGGSSRFEGSGPVEIIFFTPVANKMYVRYFRPLFSL